MNANTTDFSINAILAMPSVKPGLEGRSSAPAYSACSCFEAIRQVSLVPGVVSPYMPPLSSYSVCEGVPSMLLANHCFDSHYPDDPAGGQFATATINHGPSYNYQRLNEMVVTLPVIPVPDQSDGYNSEYFPVPLQRATQPSRNTGPKRCKNQALRMTKKARYNVNENKSCANNNSVSSLREQRPVMTYRQLVSEAIAARGGVASTKAINESIKKKHLFYANCETHWKIHVRSILKNDAQFIHTTSGWYELPAADASKMPGDQKPAPDRR